MHAILHEVVTYIMLVFFLTLQKRIACRVCRFGFVLCVGDATLERVSPQVIVLDPPEKLVLGTRSSGGYQQFDWNKNGNVFTLAQGQPFTVTLQEFSNFFEIFVRDNTTANDLGVYEVELVISIGLQVPAVDFSVTPYSKHVY